MALFSHLWISICSIMFFNHALAQPHYGITAGIKLPLFHSIHRYAESALSNSTEMLRAASIHTKLRMKRIQGRRQTVEESGYRLQGYGGAIFTKIGLGTPAQEVAALVDAGGSLVWMQCKHEYFQTSNSSTFRTVPCSSNTCRNGIPSNGGYLLNQAACNAGICNYGYNASGFNTSGTLSTDVLSLASAQIVPNLVFGCVEADESAFDLRFPVVASLALGSSSLSLLSQLPPALGKGFAYCISNANDLSFYPSPSTGRDFTGGFLYLGESASLNDEAGVKYTPLLTKGDFPYYYATLEGLSVAGQRLPISGSVFTNDPNNPATGAILDSVTALNVLPLPAFQALREAIRGIVPYPEVIPEIGSDLRMACYDVGQEAGEAFRSVLPPITFHLEGADWEFGANSSYVLVANQSMACLVTMACTDCGSFTLIGSLQQQHFKVLLDTEGQRIGFARATCE